MVQRNKKEMMHTQRPYTITAHCLIRNEENWIWYVIKSVIDHVDKILVFDTGSTDNTVEIVKSIKSPKIIFEEKGLVDKKQYTALRQEMLDRTDTSWFLILDGDEVWSKATIEELRKAIINAPSKKDTIIVGQWVCIGDIYHYSKALETFEHSQYPGMKGFRLPRAIRKTKGLHCIGLYGFESYADKNGLNVSYWEKERLIFLKNKFFHMTFLARSLSIKKDREVMMRAPKRLFYKGEPFPCDFQYPEVFYKKRPKYVPSPWQELTLSSQLAGLYYRILNFQDRIVK